MTVNKTGTDYQGLFGYTENATIKNVGLEDISVKGGDYTGGLVGNASGSSSLISSCYTKGAVSGDEYVGGLVGYTDGTIEKSYSTATVTATTKAGGLVGNTTGNVSMSYSYSDVKATDGTAGLLSGSTTGTYNNSYYNSDANLDAKTQITTSGSGLAKDKFLDLNNLQGFDSSVWEVPTDAVRPVLSTVGEDDGATPSPEPEPEPEPEPTPESSTVIRFQVGIDASDDSAINYDREFLLDLDDLDLSTVDGATAAMGKINTALDAVSKKRAEIGVLCDRLMSVYDEQMITLENTKAAKSTIMDTDVAKTTSVYTKSQILQQISASVLAQANSAPNIALSLMQ